MTELLITEVSGGLTEDNRPAIIIEFKDLANQSYKLGLESGDIDSFQEIWRHARVAINELMNDRSKLDKKG